MLLLRGLVQDTRAQWAHVPLALRGLAEDLSSMTPGWLVIPFEEIPTRVMDD